MKLIECYIENFGRLSDLRLSFSDGLNILCKENGFGKTTLTVFIKAMLFGLDDTKKARIEENDRKHYMPWRHQLVNLRQSTVFPNRLKRDICIITTSQDTPLVKQDQ